MRWYWIVILVVIIAGIVAFVSAKLMQYKKDDIIRHQRDRIRKFEKYYDLMNEWVYLKNKGYSAEHYFLAHDWKTIAIYGIGDIGTRLCEELQDTCINILYAIDKGKSESDFLPVVKMDAELQPVDVIVVTPCNSYDSIEYELSRKTTIPIISIEDVIYSMK